MMGICNSCFGSSSKYLSRSPENTFLDSDDAQKLLPKPIVKTAGGGSGSGSSNRDQVKIVVLKSPSESENKSVVSDPKAGCKDEEVPLCHSLDSGTCINEEDCFQEAADNNIVVNSSACDNTTRGSDEGTAACDMTEPNMIDHYKFGYDPLDVDPVQLTVSSMGSVAAVLEDVPEHCELGADENEQEIGDLAAAVASASLDTTSKLPPKAPLMHTSSNESTVTSIPGGSVIKNTPKVRHHSIGSRTILAANPNEGNINF